MGFAKGDSHGKSAPLSELALDVSPATVKLSQFLHQREPNSAALVRSALRALDSVEAFKQVRNLLLRNTYSGVPYSQSHRTADGLQRNLDLALKREFEGI